jgi:hypothetical protein
MATAKKAPTKAPAAPIKPSETQQFDTICELVAEGQTIRQIAEVLKCSPGHVLRIVNRADEEGQKQYARARDIAADLFESDIIMHAEASTSETAASDRVKIDALKWVAARRAPKRYSERIQQEVGNLDDKPFKTDSNVTLSPSDAYKRMLDGD